MYSAGMQLFVIRHAIAEDAVPGQADADRELTDDGDRKLRQVVKGLRNLGLQFDRVLTSPWVRARQTAERLDPISDREPVTTELLCQSPRAELLAMIAEHPTTVAVVGHEPWLSELVSWLAFGDMRHGEALDFKKAGVVWLDGSAVPGGMSVRAMLPPKVLRAIR
jgi:phosphohistidine phosphatase